MYLTLLGPTMDHISKREKLPAQAKANNLDIDDVPPHLCDFKSLGGAAHFTEDPLYEDGGTCEQHVIHDQQSMCLTFDLSYFL